MKRKRFLRTAALALSCVLMASALAACGNSSSSSSSTASSETSSSSQSSSIPDTEKTEIRVATLKGPTGIGMVKLMEDSAAGTTANSYEITIDTAPDQIVSKIASAEVDIAAVPTNLAATLFKKTNGNIQIAAVNTLGVLYIVEKGSTVQSVADLKGKTIGGSGQGSTPEYVLNYILSQNQIDPAKDAMIEYKAEHAELATALLSGNLSIAMLPEPFVTQVTTKDPDVRVALNLTEEWEKALGNENNMLAMGCLIVRKDFAEKNKAAVNSFLEEYAASTKYANEELDAASALVEKYDIMPAAVAKKAIPNCNIVCITGDEMKTSAASFLDVLFKADPKSVGGSVPDDTFYYQK